MPAAIPQFDAIKTWATAALTAGNLDPVPPVIWLTQNAPRPPRPYLTLRLDSWVPVGDDDFGAVDDEGIREVRGDREFTVQFGAYYYTNLPGGAMLLLEALSVAMQKWALRGILEAAGVAFVDMLAVQNLDALRDPQFEGRAQMDIRFRMQISSTEDAGYIKAVDIDWTANAGAEDELDGHDRIGSPETPPPDEEEP